LRFKEVPARHADHACFDTTAFQLLSRFHAKTDL
jgi:hypothetical protein